MSFRLRTAPQSASNRGRRVAGLATLCVVAIPFSATRPLRAGDEEKALREALAPFLSAASKDLTEAVAKVIGDASAHERFTDEFVKIVGSVYGARLAELEKALAEKETALAAKEARIAELESKLAAASAPAPAVVAAAEASKPAFGVRHTDADRGAAVVEVLPDSPAAAAGLRAGDIIAAIDGEAVTSEGLSAALAKRAGRDIKIGVIRGDARVELGAKLGGEAVAAAEPRSLILGIGLEARDETLVVTRVSEGKTGHALGLRVGDQLLSIGGQPVAFESIPETVASIKEGQEFSLEILRGTERLAIRGVAGADAAGKLLSCDVIGGEKEAEAAKEVERLAAHLGVGITEEARGLVVTSVTDGSGAAAYGVRVGDVIVSVNGESVDFDRLVAIAGALLSGDRVDLVLRRGDATVDLKGVLVRPKGEIVEPPAQPESAAAETPATPGKRPYLGINVYEDETAKAVVVMSVADESPAAKAGIQAGDVLVKVNGDDIADYGTLDAAIGKLAGGQAIKIVVRRGDQNVEIDLTLGSRD